MIAYRGRVASSSSAAIGRWRAVAEARRAVLFQCRDADTAAVLIDSYSTHRAGRLTLDSLRPDTYPPG